MAALVQNRNGQGNAQNSFNLAFNSNVAAGSSLIAVITYYLDTDVTISSITDSLGNTWVVNVGPQRSDIDDANKWIASCHNSGAGANTVTVNISGSAAANPYNLEIFEVSWTSGPGSFADGSSDHIHNSTVNPGNVDNSVAEAFIIAASTSYYGPPTVGSGYTAADPGDAQWYEFTQYKIVSAAASQSTAFGGTVDGWVAVAAAFQGAGGGGGGGISIPVVQGYRRMMQMR